VVGIKSVELLVTGEDDLLPTFRCQVLLVFVVFFCRLSSHAGETTVGIHLDVRVVFVTVCPDVSLCLAVRGIRLVHSLLPLCDCAVFEHVGVPLAANFDVSSSFECIWVQCLWWLIFWFFIRISEGTIGELSSFDVDACDGR